MKLAVIGLGHTGLVVAAVLAEIGHQVHGFDIESGKRSRISRGHSPFYEPDLDSLIARGLATGRLVISRTLDEAQADAEVVFLAVGTPAANGDAPNLAEFWSAAGQVVPLLLPHAVLAIKSTLPVGTTDELIARFKAQWPDAPPVVNVPEFLRQGTAVADFLRPERVIFGSHSPAALNVMRVVYEPFKLSSETIHECRPVEAELIKHAANCFLAARISYANELANLCGRLGADYEIVRHGLAADSRIGSSFLNAGLGFGGSCFPKDLAALIKTARDAGSPFTLLEATLAANRAQVHRVVALADEMVGGLSGRKVLQLGLTYKAGTDDTRGSRALELAFLLIREGAELTCHDPAYIPTEVGSDQLFTIADDPVSAASRMDLVLIATDWPEFIDLPWSKIVGSMRSARLLDGRNLLDPTEMTAAGFTYRGIGR